MATEPDLFRELASIINSGMEVIKATLPTMVEKGINSVATKLSEEELAYLKKGMDSAPMTQFYLTLAQIEKQIIEKWELVFQKDGGSDDFWLEIASLSEKYLQLSAHKDFSPLNNPTKAEIQTIKQFMNSKQYKKLIKHSNPRS